MNPKEAVIARLHWNCGGDSWGICSIGNFLAAVSGGRKLPTAVFIGCDGENEVEREAFKRTNFTLEELLSLEETANIVSAQHIKSVGSILESDNLLIIRKHIWPEQTIWTYKRLTWHNSERAYSLDEVKKKVIRK